jgi:hypothetical protein
MIPRASLILTILHGIAPTLHFTYRDVMLAQGFRWQNWAAGSVGRDER